MLRVSVSLPSGRTEKLLVERLSKVGDLKMQTESALGQRFLRLATAQNHVLTDLEESLEGAGIQDGDHLTAVTLPPHLSSTGKVFALWCSGEDKVVTWGTPEYGGDSSQSQISSRVWSKFKLQSAHLLPSSPMDLQ